MQWDRRAKGPYTPLNTDQAKILNEIKNLLFFKHPPRMIISSNKEVDIVNIIKM